MLRLNPTSIRLEARDLQWHRDRAERRQNERVNSNGRSTAEVVHHGRSSEHISTAPRSRSRLETLVYEDQSDDSLLDFNQLHISLGKVQHESADFWDSILAQTGSPTRTQEVPAQSARLVEPSDQFVHSNHSSRASLTNTNSDSEEGQDGARSHYRSRSSTVIRKKDLQKHLGFSPDSIRIAREPAENETHRTALRQSSKTRVRARVANLLRRHSVQVDGPSDRSTWTGSTEVDSSFEDDIGTCNNDLQSDRQVQLDENGIETPPRSQALGTFEHGLLSLPPRRRNHAHPPRSDGRSYQISEEHLPPPYFHSDNLGASPADKEDRGQSHRYLAPNPTDFEGAILQVSAQDATGAFMPTKTTLGQYPVSLGSSNMYDDGRYNASSSASHSPHRSASTVSDGSVQSGPTYPRLPPFIHSESVHSSLALPPPFSSTRRITSTTAPLPISSPTASLFSTPSSHRQTSTTLLQSSSLTPTTPSPISRHNQLSSSPHLPSSTQTQANPSQTLNSPRSRPSTPILTPQFSVYNDALPASTQPQTPADLRRHSNRPPPRHLFSAPPRMAGSSRRRMNWPSWTQPADFVTATATMASLPPPPNTPSRNTVGVGIGGSGRTPGLRGVLRGQRNVLVENEGSVTEDERAARRVRGLGVGMGTEEVGRSSGGL